MILYRLLLAAILATCASAQEIMGAWNAESPPTCVGLNVTLTYIKNFGDSDYAFTIDWGDATAISTENRTVQDGEIVPYSHAYAAAGSYTILATALVVSFQTEIGYTDTLNIDGATCSFEAFPLTSSPKPTPSPTASPTLIIPTIPPTEAPVVTIAPSAAGGGTGIDGGGTEPATPSPTVTPATMADFVATSDRSNPSDTSQHYIVRITDPSTIEAARNEVDKDSDFLVVTGTINKEAASWNPNWTFYIRPSTVSLTAIYSETCDVSVKFIQLDLTNAGETYLPNLQWCPSTSRILRELETSSGGDIPTDSSSGGGNTPTDSSGGGTSDSNGGGASSPNDSPATGPTSDGSGGSDEDESSSSSADHIKVMWTGLAMVHSNLLLLVLALL
ncbi:hypothetical protein MPSEU_000610700 [Mayamaea pseudoterrestris]|nr:hypothetical protein MPSEU_000610700 [Mayamaea pseudoterrestris]